MLISFILSIFLISYMSIMARASGGGLFAKKVWSRLPEILFALMIAIVSIFSGFMGFIPALLVSYFAMETGHGTFYAMQGYSSKQKNNESGWFYENILIHVWKFIGWKEDSFGPNSPRIQTMERLFRPIYTLFKGDIKHPFYSWYMMGIKGFLIALPLGVVPGLMNMLLWPTSYFLGFRVFKNAELAEYVSGALLGLIMVITVVL